MATWCSSCLGELPWLAELRAEASPARLGLVGLPVDSSDSAEQLAAWETAHDPAYVLRSDLTGARRAEVREWLTAEVGTSALPTSVVTDRAGRLLPIKAGMPTLSDLRRLLARVEEDSRPVFPFPRPR